MKRTSVLLFLMVFFAIVTYGQVKETKLTIDASDLRIRINKNIYGHFSEHLGRCIYEGYWVGENSRIPNTNGIRNDVVAALKKINVPVLRWPGGCFADEYHWKDGIGPREKRPAMINNNWGGVTEDNSFGTHEFMELCRQIECEPYISGNIGSGTVQELSQWVEYLNSDNVSPMTDIRKRNGREKSWGVKYLALGNENWGCGGNMKPQYYSDQVRRYGTYCRDYGNNKLFKIACGPSDNDYYWTEEMMKNADGFMSGLSLHHYAFNDKKIATDFNEKGWFDVIKNSLVIDEYIQKHCAIMDKYDPKKKIALIVDEWGTWYGVEPGTNPGFLYQQNTMRDAITAASNLNIFNNHCDRVRMANLAQTVNVLQSVILTDKEKIIVTPTYYVFEMYKVHQNAMWVNSKIESPDYIVGSQKLPAVNSSASIDENGKLHISLCNIDPKSKQKIICDLNNITATNGSGKILTAKVMNAHNTFDKPDEVTIKEFSDFKLVSKNLTVNMPPMSVVVLEFEGKVAPKPVIDIKNPNSGVIYDYYEGKWQKLPSFSQLVPKRSGTLEQFVIPKENSEEDFAVQYSGYIKIPKEGLYTFYINSDDGSDISIDKNVIADNDGCHAAQEQSGTVILKSGFHEITVTFFQAGGGKALDVSIEGPGMPKQVIPKELLFHK